MDQQKKYKLSKEINHTFNESKSINKKATEFLLLTVI